MRLDHADSADNMLVEFIEVFCRNPIFEMLPIPRLMNLVSCDVFAVHVEFSDIPGATVANIPSFGNVLLICQCADGIKIGCSGRRGGNARYPDAAIRSSSSGPTGR